MTPRLTPERAAWLAALNSGDALMLVGIGRPRLTSIINRTHDGDLHLSGGIIVCGEEGQDSRRERWI